MAGYVKIWTTLLTNSKYLSLSCNQRGMYLQLILIAKNQRDDGTLFFTSMAGLAVECKCDRGTASKTLGLLAEKSLLTYKKEVNGVLSIDLPTYKEWQKLQVSDVVKRVRKSPRKIASLRLDQTRLDQTNIKEEIPYEEIVEHLNKIVGTKYKPSSNKTKSLIRARWNEGFRLADFKTVHNSKFLEWKDDPKMITYLRPETLYSPKFEGYLNQREVTDPEKAMMAEMTKKYG